MYLEGFAISSPYGYRSSLGDFHAGVDYAVPVGTQLPALVDGVIQFEGYIDAAVPGYPKELICILQADGFFIVYGHLSATLVNAGQRVKAGDIIARSGNTGYSFGPHLHIEQRQGTKSSSRGLLSYASQDITPLLRAYGAQGGADDMTTEQFAAIILDVIEDKPNYKDQQPDAFRGHVDWLTVEGKKDPWNFNRWAKGIMANNGVLNATYMREHLKNDERSLAAAQSQVREVVKEVEVIKEVPVVKEVTKEVPVEVVKLVPAESFSGLELIRLGLRKWLLGGDE